MAAKCGLTSPDGTHTCIQTIPGHVDCTDMVEWWPNVAERERLARGPMTSVLDRRTPYQKKQAIKASARGMKPEERAGLIDFDAIDRPSSAQVHAADRAKVLDIYAGWDAKEATRDWIARAIEVCEPVCTQREEITTDHFWPHVDYPAFEDSNAGGRLMGRVVAHFKRKGYLVAWTLPDGSSRGYPSESLPVVYTRDGIRVQHQKIVPIYRSMLWTGVSALSD